uniref:Uncharacterized protein n=1 Tax=Brassica oleracea var. oleracea TaxID=109376 RepID=A0A0D2ZZP8_BRAOL
QGYLDRDHRRGRRSDSDSDEELKGLSHEDYQRLKRLKMRKSGKHCIWRNTPSPPRDPNEVESDENAADEEVPEKLKGESESGKSESESDRSRKKRKSKNSRSKRRRYSDSESEDSESDDSDEEDRRRKEKKKSSRKMRGHRRKRRYSDSDDE